MKPYTIIYSECGRTRVSAGPSWQVTHSQRVVTNDLGKLLKQEQYQGNTWMVFEGHPLLEGETEISPVSILTYKF